MKSPVRKCHFRWHLDNIQKTATGNFGGRCSGQRRQTVQRTWSGSRFYWGDWPKIGGGDIWVKCESGKLSSRTTHLSCGKTLEEVREAMVCSDLHLKQFLWFLCEVWVVKGWMKQQEDQKTNSDVWTRMVGFSNRNVARFGTYFRAERTRLPTVWLWQGIEKSFLGLNN